MKEYEELKKWEFSEAELHYLENSILVDAECIQNTMNVTQEQEEEYEAQGFIRDVG